MKNKAKWGTSKRGLGLFLLLGLLSGCSGTGDKVPELPDIPDAVPKVEPKSKYGNPKSYVVFGKRYHTKASSKGHVEQGLASWYGKKFHGRKTSNGERYNMYAMTAAHKTLPLPTYVRVTNLTNGRSTVVRVNDRGPFHGNRIIDLSYSAARKLEMATKGVAMVEVRTLDPSDPKFDQQDGFLASGDDTFAAKTRAHKEIIARKTPAAKLARRAEKTATRMVKTKRSGTPATGASERVADTAEPSVDPSDPKSDRQDGFLASGDDTFAAKTKARDPSDPKSDRQDDFLASGDDTVAAKTKARDLSDPKSDRQDDFLASGDNTVAAKTKARKEVVARKTPAAEPTRRAEKTATQVVKTQRSGTPATGASGRVADIAEPPAPEPEVRVLTTREKSGPPSRSSLYLQVGAFGSHVNAEHLRRRLVDHIAERVWIRTLDGKETPWYKVQVGPLASQQRARDLYRQLASLGLKGFHIIEE